MGRQGNHGILDNNPLIRLQAFCDIPFGDCAFLDDTPIGLRDIDRRGAGAGTCSSIKNQIDPTIHHCE